MKIVFLSKNLEIMKIMIKIVLFLLLITPLVNQAQILLKAGDKAPDFTSKDQNGKTVSLRQFKGKKLVLYFYPKDNTSGCTAQACSLRDNFKELKRKVIPYLE